MSSFSRAFERELAHLARDRWDQALLFAMPLLLLGVLAAMLLAGAPRELPVAVVGPDTTRAVDQSCVAQSATSTREKTCSGRMPPSTASAKR